MNESEVYLNELLDDFIIKYNELSNSKDFALFENENFIPLIYGFIYTNGYKPGINRPWNDRPVYVETYWVDLNQDNNSYFSSGSLPSWDKPNQSAYDGCLYPIVSCSYAEALYKSYDEYSYSDLRYIKDDIQEDLKFVQRLVMLEALEPVSKYKNIETIKHLLRQIFCWCLGIHENIRARAMYPLKKNLVCFGEKELLGEEKIIALNKSKKHAGLLATYLLIIDKLLLKKRYRSDPSSVDAMSKLFGHNYEPAKENIYKRYEEVRKENQTVSQAYDKLRRDLIELGLTPSEYGLNNDPNSFNRAYNAWKTNELSNK